TSARVTITTKGAAADIFLDDRNVGVASQTTELVVLLSPKAPHKLRADRPGQDPDQITMPELSGGEQQSVVLEPKVKPPTARLRISTNPARAHLSFSARDQVEHDLGDAPVEHDLPAGDYTVFARLSGYERAHQPVSIEQLGVTRDIAIRLKPLPTWWERNR